MLVAIILDGAATGHAHHTKFYWTVLLRVSASESPGGPVDTQLLTQDVLRGAPIFAFLPEGQLMVMLLELNLILNAFDIV